MGVHPLPAGPENGAARSIAVVLTGLGVVGLGLIWMMLVPPAFSPLALGQADALVGRGQPHAAVRRYEAIGRNGWNEATRQKALQRAALVMAVDLGNPARALELQESLLRREISAARRAQVHEEMANLHVELRALEEGAWAFEAAYRADPEGVGAARRLRTAARLLTELKQHERARMLWTEVSDAFPGEAALARVGLAGIALREGDPQRALRLFEEAEESSFDEGVQGLARLGASTCLERLGDLDQALAELDELDLPSDVLYTRREGIRDRQYRR